MVVLAAVCVWEGDREQEQEAYEQEINSSPEDQGLLISSLVAGIYSSLI